MGTLKKLQGYMGQRRILFPLSLILSALSALAGLVPYILIWLIVKELLVPETTCNTDMMVYAWWAAGLAVGGVLLYFAALMASHLAAFRVESNIRRDAMKRVVAMPLRFFDQIHPDVSVRLLMTMPVLHILSWPTSCLIWRLRY